MSNSNYSCTACGNITSKWAGRCEACGEWNSISEDTGLSQGPTKISLGRSRGHFIPLNNLKSTEKPLQRIKCDLDELDRVLG
ncbi:MAG: DNA repair protein RadA, partial [Paracoccaceae bacterium]